MAAAAMKPNHYHITVNVTVKRSKEEIQFAEKETDKLYSLISSDKQVDWSKERIAALHKMTLNPADDIKKDVIEKLTSRETAETLDAKTIDSEDSDTEE